MKVTNWIFGTNEQKSSGVTSSVGRFDLRSLAKSSTSCSTVFQWGISLTKINHLFASIWLSTMCKSFSNHFNSCKLHQFSCFSLPMNKHHPCQPLVHAWLMLLSQLNLAANDRSGHKRYDAYSPSIACSQPRYHHPCCRWYLSYAWLLLGWYPISQCFLWEVSMRPPSIEEACVSFVRYLRYNFKCCNSYFFKRCVELCRMMSLTSWRCSEIQSVHSSRLNVWKKKLMHSRVRTTCPLDNILGTCAVVHRSSTSFAHTFLIRSFEHLQFYCTLIIVPLWRGWWAHVKRAWRLCVI